MTITRSGMSLEQFLTLPDEKPALEYEGGQVTQKVSPKAKHGRLQFRLAALLASLFEPRRVGMVFTETRTTFAGASRVPDVAVFRWERVPRDEHGEPENDLLIPPDIAVEIRSPSQSLQSQLNRCRDYVSQGVTLALVLDPERHRLWEFRPGQSERELGQDEPIDFGGLIDAMLTAGEIFRALRID